jgi:hypothetical protein
MLGSCKIVQVVAETIRLDVSGIPLRLALKVSILKYKVLRCRSRDLVSVLASSEVSELRKTPRPKSVCGTPINLNVIP